MCVKGLTARATKLRSRRGGVVPPHSSGAHVWFLYRSWCYAMPLRGLYLSRRWPLAIRRRIGRMRLARNCTPCFRSDLCLPATLPGPHNDPAKPSGTWCSRTRWHKIDFVAVPRDWFAGVKRAEVVAAVALPGNGAFDHATPVVEVVSLETCGSSGASCFTGGLDGRRGLTGGPRSRCGKKSTPKGQLVSTSSISRRFSRSGGRR